MLISPHNDSQDSKKTPSFEIDTVENVGSKMHWQYCRREVGPVEAYRYRQCCRRRVLEGSLGGP